MEDIFAKERAIVCSEEEIMPRCLPGKREFLWTAGGDVAKGGTQPFLKPRDRFRARAIAVGEGGKLDGVCVSLVF